MSVSPIAMFKGDGGLPYSTAKQNSKLFSERRLQTFLNAVTSRKRNGDYYQGMKCEWMWRK